MRPYQVLGDLFGNLFHDEPVNPDPARRAIRQEWARQRAAATSPAGEAEIDAIFARHL